jgi:hypothetical protein
MQLPVAKITDMLFPVPPAYAPPKGPVAVEARPPLSGSCRVKLAADTGGEFVMAPTEIRDGKLYGTCWGCGTAAIRLDAIREVDFIQRVREWYAEKQTTKR